MFELTDNQKKIGIGVVVVILCALAYYFLYWIKTPTYSLALIREALQKHDVTKFEKHVDLDSLYNKAFEDAIVGQSKITGEDIMSNPFAAGILMAMKPATVSYLKHETIKVVKGQEVKTEKSKKQDSPIAEALSGKFGKQTNEIKDVSTISKEGNIANVLIKIYDSSVKGEYEVKLKMSRLDDDTWRVIEVTNLPEMMVTMDKLYKKRLAEINAPIQKQIEESMKITLDKIYVLGDGNPFFETYKVNIPVTFENLSEKDIEYFKCGINIKDVNGKSLQSGVFSDMKTLKAKTKFSTSLNKKLNQFINEDKKIINNPNGTKAEGIIELIKFSDGTELKLYDTIPEPEKTKK